MRKLFLFVLPLFLFSCSSITREEFNALIEAGDISAVEKSIDKLPSKEKNEILVSGLSVACSLANSEMATILLDQGAVPSSRNLMSACQSRMSEVALRMAKSDSEIGNYIDDYNGANPLQYALAYGQEEAAKEKEESDRKREEVRQKTGICTNPCTFPLTGTCTDFLH